MARGSDSSGDLPLLPLVWRRAVERLAFALYGAPPGAALRQAPRRGEIAALWRARHLRARGPRGVPVSRLREALAPRLTAARVVGFDLFDTLLVRRVDPEWVKTAAAWGLAGMLRSELGSGAPDRAEVRHRRSELEGAVAAERVARGEDDEVDHAVLVPRLVGSWIPSGEARDRLVTAATELELAIEERVLEVVPGTRELLEWVRGEGKRVVFATDMYFTSAQIRRLLRATDLERFFDAGYVSNDLGVRKASGRLFERLLAEERISPAEFLFVGDSPWSDRDQPRRLGIPWLLVADPEERRRRRRQRALRRLAEESPFWRGPLCAEALRGHPRSCPAGAGVGGRVGWLLAPSVVAFALHVAEQAAELGFDRLYFLSREGLVLQRVYRILKRRGVLPGGLPPDRYLFLSRASTFLASMAELSEEEVLRYTIQYREQSLLDVLRNLSLPRDPFVGIAASCGLDEPDRPMFRPTEDPAFRRFLASPEARAGFAVHRDRARATLRRYLEQQQLFGTRRVAFIDIGWKGSMQDNVVAAFRGSPGFPEVHGLYLGYQVPEAPPPPPWPREGYLADTRRGDTDDEDFFLNSSIFEMATTANHGTTTGYRPGRGNPQKLVPVLEHHEVERGLAERFFLGAQEAIYAHARAFAEMRPALPFSSEELRAGVLAPFLRYARYPTRAEAREFLRYAHVESFGVEEVTTYDLRLDPWRWLRRGPLGALRQLYREFQRNPWRPGVVRRSGLPFGVYLYDLWRAMRVGAWRRSSRILARSVGSPRKP